MIIRATFKDNDYTSFLENYFEHFMFENYRNFLSEIENPKEYINKSIEAENSLQYAIYNYDKDLECNKEKCEIELHKFLDIVRTSIGYYLEKLVDTETYEYLMSNLVLNASNNMTHKYENGEVIYCFIPQSVILRC